MNKNYITGLFLIFPLVITTGCTVKTETAKKSAVNIIQEPLKDTQQASSSDLSKASIACIESTCGNKNPFAHPFTKSADLQAITEAIVEKALKKDVQNYMGRTIHRALIADKLFKNLDINNITLSKEQVSLLLSMKHINKISEYSAAIDNSKGKYEFNKEKLKLLLKDSDESVIDAILSLNDLLNTLMVFSDLASRGYEQFMNAIHHDITLIEAQAEEAKGIIAINTRIETLIPAYIHMKRGSEIINKAIAKKSLSSSEQKIMLDLIQKKFAFIMLLDLKVQVAFSKIPFKLDQIFTEAQEKYQSSEVGRALKTPSTIKSIFNTAVKSCITRLAYSHETLPSQQQIETFKNLFSLMKLKAQTLIEEKSKSSLSEPLQMPLSFPMAKEDSLADWQEGLRLGTANSEEIIKKMNSADFNKAEMAQSLVVILAVFGQDKLLDEVLSYCDKTEPAFLSDAAYQRTGLINLSWTSVVHPELGLSIAAHELGHVISAKFPNETKAEKECLIALQGTSQFTEEDFADLFSAEIHNQFSAKVNEIPLSNLGCALNFRNQTGWIAGGLKNDDATAKHSTGFYRLLSTGAMTSTQTKECGSYTQLAGKNNLFSNYCKWQR